MFNQEKESQLHKKAEKMSLEELNKWFDEVNDKINTSVFSFNENEKNSILAALNTKGMFNLDFKLAKSYLGLRKTISDHSKINSREFRILQQIMVSLRFTSPVEAEIVANAIDAVTANNAEINSMESELRIISTYITRKEQEATTGLEYSEEDTKNMQILDGAKVEMESQEEATEKKSTKKKAEKTKTEKAK